MEKVERAIALSAQKYCQAISKFIAKTATITDDFEVVDATAKRAGTREASALAANSLAAPAT